MNPSMQGGFQTLGHDDNPLARALAMFKPGAQPTTQTPQPGEPVQASGVMDKLSEASDKLGMVGDHIDGGGLASVAAQVMDTMVNKRASEIAERGAATDREYRLAKSRGLDVAKPPRPDMTREAMDNAMQLDALPDSRWRLA